MDEPPSSRVLPVDWQVPVPMLRPISRGRVLQYSAYVHADSRLIRRVGNLISAPVELNPLY